MVYEFFQDCAVTILSLVIYYQSFMPIVEFLKHRHFLLRALTDVLRRGIMS